MGIRQITDVLREQGGGALIDEFSAEYNKLVRAVRKTGKGGEITLKLKVKPAAKNNADMVTIEDDVVSKLPRPDRFATLAYTTPEGNTQLRNPVQPDLAGLSVAVDNDDVVSVDAGDDQSINLN